MDREAEPAFPLQEPAGPGTVLRTGAGPGPDQQWWCARGELNPHVLSDTRT